MDEPKKRCMGCGEPVLAVARKCKQCGSALEVGKSLVTPIAASTAEAVTHRPTADFGVALMALPVLSALLMFEWVGEMRLVQNPSSILLMLGVSTILLTASMTAWETSCWGSKSESRPGAFGPSSWFFLTAALWVVGYPAYLFARRQGGLRNLLYPGLIVALLFVGGWSLTALAINSREDQVQLQASKASKDYEEARVARRAAKELSQTGAQQTHAIAEDLDVVARKAALLARQGTYRYFCVDHWLPRGVTKLGSYVQVVPQVAKHGECGEVPDSFIDCFDSPGTTFKTCFLAEFPKDREFWDDKVEPSAPAVK